MLIATACRNVSLRRTGFDVYEYPYAAASAGVITLMEISPTKPRLTAHFGLHVLRPTW